MAYSTLELLSTIFLVIILEAKFLYVHSGYMCSPLLCIRASVKIKNFEQKINYSISPSIQDVLFAVLVANNQVITFIRPKEHSLLPLGKLQYAASA